MKAPSASSNRRSAKRRRRVQHLTSLSVSSEVGIPLSATSSNGGECGCGLVPQRSTPLVMQEDSLSQAAECEVLESPEMSNEGKMCRRVRQFTSLSASSEVGIPLSATSNGGECGCGLPQRSTPLVMQEDSLSQAAGCEVFEPPKMYNQGSDGNQLCFIFALIHALKSNEKQVAFMGNNGPGEEWYSDYQFFSPTLRFLPIRLYKLSPSNKLPFSMCFQHILAP